MHMNHLFRTIVGRLQHASERERDELLALVDEVVPAPADDADVPEDGAPEPTPAPATLTKGK